MNIEELRERLDEGKKLDDLRHRVENLHKVRDNMFKKEVRAVLLELLELMRNGE